VGLNETDTTFASSWPSANKLSVKVGTSSSTAGSKVPKQIGELEQGGLKRGYLPCVNATGPILFRFSAFFATQNKKTKPQNAIKTFEPDGSERNE
jgi:hypothetical protein